MWKTCGLYLSDCWYCNEDIGLNCGIARKERRSELNKKSSYDFVSLNVIFEEQQEAVARQLQSAAQKQISKVMASKTRNTKHHNPTSAIGKKDCALVPVSPSHSRVQKAKART
jgi:hypothetical protein